MRSRFVLAGLVLAVLAAACGGGGETSVFDLGVGDCFDDWDDLTQTQVFSVETVDCSEGHDNEIYFVYSMSDPVFPGEDAAFQSAFSTCREQFGSFVGTPYMDSSLDLFPITPTAGSWLDGDRIVYCALYAMDLSKLRGSMRGSGI